MHMSMATHIESNSHKCDISKNFKQHLEFAEVKSASMISVVCYVSILLLLSQNRHKDSHRRADEVRTRSNE